MTVVGGGQPSLLKCTRKCHVLYWSGAVNPTTTTKYCHYFDDGFICFLCFYFIDIFIYFICNIYVYGTKLWFFFICSFAVGRILNPIVYELTGAFA